MNILIATGHLALDTVKDAAGDKAEILLVDTEVAAFITPGKLLDSYLKSYKPNRFDLLLVPGLVSGDFSATASKMGCPIYRGSKHAYDLATVLRFADDITFSTEIPACELIEGIRKEEALNTLQELEESASPAFNIRDLKIGGNSGMKVMAEIVDAASMNEVELNQKIKHFLHEGTSIIDLGIAMTSSAEAVEETIKVARKATDIPLSIDTTIAEHILCGVENGVDLVLSLNSSNIDSTARKIAEKNIAAVVIPDPGKGHDSLIKNVEKCREYGIKKIIADPILDPAGHGFTESIIRYRIFAEQYPDIPLFFGAGNVTELFDADSTGINALLCTIASDTGSSILFTPEYSDKTQGSISELKTAAGMMKLAEFRKSSPKDLGFDLVHIKEKRKRLEIPMPKDAIAAKPNNGWELDPKGPFRIGITHDPEGRGYIVAEHEKTTIIGKTASEVLDSIITNDLVSKFDHAGYLGMELKKAEIALQFNRSYEQDDVF
ncbi:dihydropteroate synthase-like protein [Methanohalophilus levihalophilus]|uniref:dihydropteroate synthase-like protein n=1 Tax=Methanohalophilus levihalophilus TaxID=1431282 RepID=UPI001AE239F3|nr:dihydropteroate synthase-like protein [Methanohalophilus levihalophilus]MBP2029690.1 dihydropteroate synthase-like protein [Methanohalophilus levihalophilus]